MALPALSVRGPALRRSLKLATAGWMFGVVWMVSTGGSPMEIFTRMLGFDDFALGVLAAIPFVATFFQLLATILIERTGLTKYQFIQFATIHRVLWLLVAAIPLLLPIPSSAAVISMLLVLLLSGCTEAMSRPAWLTWMGALIPPRIRGRYWGMRRQLTTIVQIVAAVGIGATVTCLYDRDMALTKEAQPALLRAILAILIVGGVFGIIDILLFHGIREVMPPRRANSQRQNGSDLAGAGGASGWARRRSMLQRLLWQPLTDREFRGYVIYGACMTFAMTAGSWFFWRNMRENLKLNPLEMNVLFMVIGPLVALLSARAVGRAIDTWGRRPVLIIATIGTLFSILPWFFISYGMPGMILICVLPSLIGGIAWQAVNMAQVNIMLRFADGDGQSRYVAAFGLYVSIGGVLGGLAGGAVAWALDFLQKDPIVLGPFLWNNWHAVFALSLLARLMALLFLRGMHDPGAAPARLVIRSIRVNVYNAIAPRLFYPLRVFGWKVPMPQRRRSKKRD